MFLPFLIAFIIIVVTNFLYSIVAYSEKCQQNAVYAYSLAIFSALISIIGWLYLARHYKEPNSIMVINCIWDVGGTITLLLLPLLVFDFKIDTKTIIGCVIAVIGIIIAKI